MLTMPRYLLFTLVITLLSFAKGFAQTSTTVYTDKPDYHPGDTVIIQGDGWQPGEQVKLEIDHSTITHGNTVLYATANGGGHIYNNEFIIQPQHLGENFTLAATGQSSGRTAQTAFTDAQYTVSLNETWVALPAGVTSSDLIKITNGATLTIDADLTVGEVQAGQTGSSNSGTLKINSSRTFTVTGNVAIGTTANAGTLTTQGTLKIGGAFALTAGMSTFNASTGTIEYNSTSAQTVVATTYNNLVVSGNRATNSVTLAAGTLNVSGDYTASATFTSGNYIVTGNTVSLNGGSQSISGTPTFDNFISAASGAKSFASNSTTTILGNLSWSAGSSSSSASAKIIFTGSGKQITSSSILNFSEVKIENGASITHKSGELRVAKNFTNNGTFTQDAGQTITFNGSNSTAQSISGSTTSFKTLKIATTGSGGVTISTDVSVDETLNLTSGLITTGSNVVKLNAAANITNASSSSYINGRLARSYNATGSKTFPIGKGGNYRPLSVNYTALTGTSTVTAEQIESALSGTLPSGSILLENRYWTVTQSGGSAFTYNISLDPDALTPTGQVYVEKNTGGTATESVAATPNYTASDLSGFGDFALAHKPCSTPSVITQPSAQSKTYGDDAQFTFTTNAANYQWQVSTDGGGSWTNLSDDVTYTGSTTNQLTVKKSPYSFNTYQYRCVASATCDALLKQTSNAVLLTVLQRTITITADAKSKTYGNADPALTYQITDGSLVTGDVFTGTVSRASGENVAGSPYPIQQGTLALSNNYALTFAGANFTINPAAAIISLSNLSKTYNGSPQGATVTTSPTGLAYNITYNGGTTVPTNAGSYSAVAALNDANYTSTNATGTLLIDKATTTITWPNPANIVYGTPLSATQLNASASVGGTFSYSPANGDYLNTGNGQTLSVNFTPTDVVNYNMALGTATINVTKAAAAIAVNGYTGTYDGAAHSATLVSATGARNEDLNGLVSFTNNSYTDAPGGTVGWSFAGDANHNASSGTASVTIGKAATTTTVTVSDGTYNSNPQGGSATVSSAAGLNQSLSVSYVGTGSTSYGPSATPPTDAGTYNAAATYNESTNYFGSTDVKAFAIGKAAARLNLSGLNYAYDGTAKSASVTTNPSGLNGVSITYNGSAMAPINAGSYNIVASLVNANYMALNVTGILEIGKATPVITWSDPADITYGTALTAVHLNATANVSGSFAYTPASGNYLNAGNGQSLSVIFTPADNSNYNSAFASATIDVAKANATINVNSYTGVYDNAAHGATGTATGARGEGLAAYLHFGLSFTNVPGGTAAWTFDGDANHNTASGNATITVTQATPAVSATGGNFTYNGATQAGSGTATGVSNAALVPVSLSYSGTGSTTYGPTNTAPVNAGSYTVTASYAGATNYTSNTSAPASLVIAPRAITITADAKSKVYGANDPSLTAQVTTGSLVNGETEKGSLTRASGETVGAYAISQNTYTYGSNYSETFVGANLAITQKSVNVTADVQTKVYGAADPALTYTATGLVGTDALTGNLARTSGNDVGQYLIDQGTLANGNYNIIFTPNVYLSITPKSLTPSFTAADKAYDRTIAATISTRSLTGILYSDDVSLATSGTAAFGSKEAGNNKTVTATGFSLGGSKAGNYSLSSVSATTMASILQKALTGSVTAADKTYNGSVAANITDRNLTGVIATDAVSYTGGSASFNDASVGIGKTVTATGLSLSGADAGNYTVNTSALTTASITAKSLVAAITAADKIYDGLISASATAQTLSGVEGSDDVSVSVSNAQFNNKNVGSNKPVTATVSLGGSQANNYSLSAATASAQANISALGITGSITANNKIYDGTTVASIALRNLTGALGTDDVTYSGGSASFADKNVGNGKAIAASGLSLSGADAGNYTVNATASTTANITALDITGNFTPADKVYDGNALATVNSRSLNGAINGDVVQLTGGSANFDNKNVGTGKPVTATGMSLAGADAGNYNLTAVNGSMASISALTITGNFSASDKVYDGGTAAVVNGRTLSGVVSGNDVQLVGGTAAFDTKNAGSNKTVTAFGMTLNGTDAGNYTLFSVANTTASISQLSVTGSFTASNKVYNGNTEATVQTRSLVGTISSDNVSLAGGVATFDTKNAGTDKIIILSGAGLSGSDANNYTLSSIGNATADITARLLTVNASGINKVYDGTTATSVTLSDNRVSGDLLSLNYGSASFANKNIGRGKQVSVSDIAISGTDAANYLANAATTTLADITARSLTATATGVNKIYDGNIVATVTFTDNRATGDVLTVVYSAASFNDKNVGTGKSVNVSGISISGADGDNYAVNTTAVAAADITPRPLTVSAAGVHKVYDGTTASTVSLFDNRITGDVLSATYTAASFSDKNVGTGKSVSVAGISLSGLDAGNYSVNVGANTTADITVKSASVSPNAIGKVYGNADPNLTGTLSGFIASDNIMAGYSRTSGETVGGNPYTISASLSPVGELSNYNITYNTALFTIAARGLAISASGQNKVYDGTADATAILSSDKQSSDIVVASYTSAVFNNKQAGTSKPVSVSGIAISGADAGNYSLLNTITYTTADITAKALNVTATGINKIYDGATIATVNLSDNRLNGDILTASYARAIFTDKNVGMGKVVAVSGISVAGLDAGNYTFNGIATTTAEITAKSASVIPAGAGKIYGAADPAFSGALNGFVAADDITAAYSRTMGETVGNYTISAALNPADALTNYSISYNTAGFNITEKTLIVSAAGINKVYDGNNIATITLSTDKLGSDDVTAAYTGASFSNKNAGTGKAVSVSGISISGADASNYTLSNATASTTANITQKPLSVSATASNKVYDGAAIASVNLSDNRISGDVLTTAYTSATFTDKNVGNGKTVTISGINISGTDAGNYTVNNLATATANITERTLVISAAGVSKVYDANTGATVNLSDNRVTGDALTTAYANASFADKNIGNGKGVSVNGITLNGADADNYTFNTTAGAIASITARALTVSATGVNKVYDGNAITTVTLSDNKVSGDAVTTAYTSASFNDKNAGTAKPVTVSGISISGGDGENYTFNATANTTANITARTLVVTATGNNKVYDGNTAAAVNLSDDRVNGDVLTISYLSATFGDKNVGNGKGVSVNGISVGSTDAGNYAANNAAATTANITARPIAITASAKTKVYGNTDPALTAITANVVAGDIATGVLSRTAGEDVGSYAIGQNTYTFGSNYAESFVPANLTVTLRAITVTADTKSKVYGTADPALTYQVTAGSLAFSDVFSGVLNRDGGEGIGSYAIRQNALVLNSNYALSYVGANLSITTAPVTLLVGTNMASQQYSDKVSFTAKVKGGAELISGAGGAAQNVTFKVGMQVMGTASLTVDPINGNDLIATLDKQLVEGIAGEMLPSATAKNVTAIFNAPNLNYGLNTGNNTKATSLTITKENADITYTGQDYIALPSTTATSVTVSLSVTVRDLFSGSDADRGNIKNARVTFRRDNPLTGTVLGTASLPVSLVTDSTVGIVSTSFSYTLTNTEQQAGGANLQVYAVVDNYYTGGTSDVATTITIARPGSDFVTGGGYLVNANSTGTIAGTAGLKTNFGFNMQYNKSGANLKGQCNIIVRSGGRIYQIKSNAVNTLVVYSTTASGTQAYFNTKANYSDITDPNTPISLGGNMDLTVKMNDVSQGGQGDQVSVVLMNPNTSELAFSSKWDGVQTVLQNLGGGNVSVRSTPSSAAPTAAPAMTLAPAGEQLKISPVPFDVRVAGNPSATHFDLQFSGSNEPINLVIADITGKVMEARQNLQAGTSVRVGDKLMTGIYFLQAVQGRNKKQIKLVKM